MSLKLRFQNLLSKIPFLPKFLRSESPISTTQAGYEELGEGEGEIRPNAMKQKYFQSLAWTAWFMDLFAPRKNAEVRKQLKEVIEAYETRQADYEEAADSNLQYWREKANLFQIPFSLSFEDTLTEAWVQTERTGEEQVIVNFANAYHVGGVFRTRVGTQEEDIARRTNWTFTHSSDEIEADDLNYKPDMSELINGKYGRVYLNPQKLILIRDNKGNLLDPKNDSDRKIFSCYELRAAADDLRRRIFNIPLPFWPKPFDENSMRQKIYAQLDTLVEADKKYLILGAFGCGAFKNDCNRVAELYYQILNEEKYKDFFISVVFAIKGNGSDENYRAFQMKFGFFTLTEPASCDSYQTMRRLDGGLQNANSSVLNEESEEEQFFEGPTSASLHYGSRVGQSPTSNWSSERGVILG